MKNVALFSAFGLALVATACQPKKPQVATVKDTTTIGERTVDLTKNQNADGVDAERLKAEIAKRRAKEPYESSYECLTAQSQKIVDHFKRTDPNSPFVRDITIDELTAIRIYTGSAYRDINGLLRQKNAAGLKEWEGTIGEASSGLVKLQRNRAYREEVKRGASLDEAKIKPYRDALASGKPITERAFVSSSYAGGGFGGSVKFLIRGRTGVRIDEISIFPNEKEVLFPPGAEFRVTSVEKKKLAREAPVEDKGAATWEDGKTPEICEKEMEAASKAASNGNGDPSSSSSVRAEKFTDEIGIGEGAMWAGDGPSSRPPGEAIALVDVVGGSDGTSDGDVQQPQQPVQSNGGGSGGYNDGGLGTQRPEEDEEVTVIMMEEVTGT